MQKLLLSINNLSVVFNTYAGQVQAVNDVSFTLNKGEVLGIVGESGCGKSVTANAIMRLIPSPPGEISKGTILFKEKNLVTLPEKDLRQIRGNAISMIFQDPMTSLNPVLTVGLQLAESFMIHQKLSKEQSLHEAIKMLNLVGIPAPAARIRQYPHQLSGGMRQRVMIAMALACKPQVLIADEPTTALDVTIQAQIIDLMRKLNKELATSIILISHDLGVVAGLCERVQVMYAGRIVETAPIKALYKNPSHPYTWGLLNSVPRMDQNRMRLHSIAGQPPDLLNPPPGCAFRPRCKFAMTVCSTLPPLIEVDSSHYSRCWLNHVDSPYKPELLFREGLANDK